MSNTHSEVQTMSLKELYDKGLALYNEGLYGNAKKVFDQIIQVNPELSDVYNMSGVSTLRYLQETSNIPKQDVSLYAFDAREYLQKAIALNPSIAEYHYNLALLQKFINSDEVIEELKTAVYYNPNLLAAHYELVLHYYENKQYDLALPHLEMLLNNDKHYLLTLEYAAIIYYHLHRVTEAEQCVSQLPEGHEFSYNFHLAKAEYLFAIAEYEQAFELFNQSLLALEDCSDAYVNLMILYAGVNKPLFMQQIFEQVLAKYADSPAVLLVMADKLVDVELLSYALALYAELLHHQGYTTDAATAIALIALESGDFDKYCVYMEQAIEFSSDNQVLYERYYSDLFANKAYDKAWRYYNQATKMNNPNSYHDCHYHEWNGAAMATKDLLVFASNTLHDIYLVAALLQYCDSPRSLSFVVDELYYDLFSSLLSDVDVICTSDIPESHDSLEKCLLGDFVAHYWQERADFVLPKQYFYSERERRVKNQRTVLLAVNYDIDFEPLITQYNNQHGYLFETIASSDNPFSITLPEKSSLITKEHVFDNWSTIISALQDNAIVISDNPVLAQVAAGMGKKVLYVATSKAAWYFPDHDQANGFNSNLHGCYLASGDTQELFDCMTNLLRANEKQTVVETE